MPRVSTSTTHFPVKCSFCDAVTCFVAPGEAKRLARRTVVHCADCETRPYPLTERQFEMLDKIVRLHSTLGRTPSYAEIGDAMGVTKSRIQAMHTAVSARGWSDQLSEAMKQGHFTPPYIIAPVRPAQNLAANLAGTPYEVETSLPPVNIDGVDEN